MQNMGQRFLQLENTYTAYADNKTAVLHVRQMPPNAAIFPPGPALIFVVVNGVPSVGKMIMVGNGQIGDQPVQAAASLSESVVVPATNGGVDGEQGGNGSSSGVAAVKAPAFFVAVAVLVASLWS